MSEPGWRPGELEACILASFSSIASIGLGLSDSEKVEHIHSGRRALDVLDYIKIYAKVQKSH